MRASRLLTSLASVVVCVVFIPIVRADPATTAAATTAATTTATTQTLEQKLIDLAPVLSSADETTRTLDVQVRVPIAGGDRACDLSVRGLYQAPDRYAVYVSDARDGTPLFINIGDRILVYDPVDGVLRTREGVPELGFLHDGKTYNIAWRAYQPGEKTPSIRVDLTSIVRFPVKPSARALGEGRYILTQTTPKGNPVESEIDLGRACPYVRIDSGFVYQPLRLNEPVDPRAFDVPTDAELSKRFTVADFPAEGLLDQAKSIAAVQRTALIRLAALDPELRQLVDGTGLKIIDWEKVAENDRKLAPLMREMFPCAVAPRPERKGD